MHADRNGFIIAGQVWANCGDAGCYFHPRLAPSCSCLDVQSAGLTPGGIMAALILAAAGPASGPPAIFGPLQRSGPAEAELSRR